jgi:hypothetical protein
VVVFLLVVLQSGIIKMELLNVIPSMNIWKGLHN